MRNVARRCAVVGVTLAVVCLISSTGTACGGLSVTSGAALDGNYGLEIVYDGNDLDPCYVFDATPDNETTLRALFKMEKETGFLMAIRDGHDIYRATNPSGTAVQMKLRYFDVSGGTPYVQVQAKKDDGSWSRALMAIAPSRHGWMIEWQAASAPGANDGFLRLYKRNGDGTYSCLKQGTGIDNDTQTVGGQYLGAMGGIDASTVGTFNVDSFESYRTVDTGPVTCAQTFPEP